MSSACHVSLNGSQISSTLNVCTAMLLLLPGDINVALWWRKQLQKFEHRDQRQESWAVSQSLLCDLW